MSRAPEQLKTEPSLPNYGSSHRESYIGPHEVYERKESAVLARSLDTTADQSPNEALPMRQLSIQLTRLKSTSLTQRNRDCYSSIRTTFVRWNGIPKALHANFYKVSQRKSFLVITHEPRKSLDIEKFTAKPERARFCPMGLGKLYTFVRLSLLDRASLEAH